MKTVKRFGVVGTIEYVQERIKKGENTFFVTRPVFNANINSNRQRG